MPNTAETITLPGAMPATTRQLRVFSFGEPGARPKAYLQAGLHADEPAGMMILRELCRLLAAAEDAGEIRGEIVVVPVANPLGIDQAVNAAFLRRLAGLAAVVSYQWCMPVIFQPKSRKDKIKTTPCPF